MSPGSVPEHEPAARRTNEKWSESEYGQLIEILRDGLPLEDIAAQLGRGVDAVASRCVAPSAPERWTAKTCRMPTEHVSLHARPEDARQALDRLLTGHLDRGGSTEEVSVTLAQRTVGDLAIGDSHHEHAPQPSTPAPPN